MSFGALFSGMSSIWVGCSPMEEDINRQTLDDGFSRRRD